MQSFKLHIVSEHLLDRHPYLEPEFRDRYDKTEVTLAVFDRSIPKLIEIIMMEDLEEYKYRDALRTLNEMVSHQENKSIIIDADINERLYSFLKSENIDIRRETTLLLGSMFTISRGRAKLNEKFYFGVDRLLFDKYRDAREAVAWAINRIALSRDGVASLIKYRIVSSLIKAFHQFSDYNVLSAEDLVGESKFLIYLLEAFLNILVTDDGISFFFGTKTVNRMNQILLRAAEISGKEQGEGAGQFKEATNRLNALTLHCLSKLAVNPSSKKECVEEKVIFTANKYLRSPHEGERYYAVELIMFCTILLDGKKQCVFYEKDEILKNLIQLLLDYADHQELVKLVKQTLINIADLPKGFSLIAFHMSQYIDLLDNIFGVKAVKYLADLLPNPTKLATPPIIPAEQVMDLKSVFKALAHFLKKYDEALVVATEECVKLSERIILFLYFRNDKQLQDMVVQSLYRIASKDEYNRNALKTFLETYGEIRHPAANTTLAAEVNRFNKLLELLIKEESSNETP